MDYPDEEFLRSGIEDKALYLEFKAIVQPFFDRAHANPLGDRRALQAETRVAVMEFLKSTTQNCNKLSARNLQVALRFDLVLCEQSNRLFLKAVNVHDAGDFSLWR